MGLRIQRAVSVNNKLIMTLVAVFALVAQPFYGLVASRVANAIESTPEVTINEASYVKTSEYGGIYIGFNTKDISTASAIELRVNSDTGLKYSIYAKPSVLGAVNAAAMGTTHSVGGTVIVTGSRTSSSWSDQTGTWYGVGRPAAANPVQVIITLNDSTVLTANASTITNNGATETEVFSTVPATPEYVAPITVSPNGWHVSNNVNFKWNAPVSGPAPDSYEVITGNHPNVDSDGKLTSGVVVQGSDIAGLTFTKTLASGPYQWQVRAKYSDGNFGPWSGVRPIQVIGVPEITSPTPSLWSSADTFTATWKGVYAPGQVKQYEVRYEVDRNGDGIVDTNTDGSKKYEYRKDIGDQLYRKQGWNDVEGPLTIAVRAEFKQSFAGMSFTEWSPAVAYGRDITKPSAGITSAIQTASDRVEFSGYVYDKNFSHYYCYITSPGGGELSGTRDDNCVTTWASDLQRNGNPATPQATGAGSLESPVRLGGFSIGSLSSGDYTVHLVAVDRAGTKSDEFAYGITIDRTSPNGSVSVTGGGTQATATLGSLSEEIKTPEGWTKAGAEYTRIHVLNGEKSVEIEDLFGNKRVITYIVNSIEEVVAPGPETNPGGPIIPGPVAEEPTVDDESDTSGSTPALFAVASPQQIAAAIADNNEEVLGVQSEGNDRRSIFGNDTSDILGVTASPKNADGSWNLLGLAWYWWLVAAAAVIGAGWWLLAAIRRRQDEAADV